MNRNKLILVICIFLGVILVLTVIFLFYKSKNVNATPIAGITQTIIAAESPSEVVVSQSVAATRTATRTATATATPESTQTPGKSKIDLIKEALNAKFSSGIISASISKESENSAYGDFSLSEEGGYFVAVKDGDGWKIIADGNGTIECSVLDANNVPASVVAECYDTPSESSKTR